MRGHFMSETWSYGKRAGSSSNEDGCELVSEQLFFLARAQEALFGGAVMELAQLSMNCAKESALAPKQDRLKKAVSDYFHHYRLAWEGAVGLAPGSLLSNYSIAHVVASRVRQLERKDPLL